MGNPSPTEAPDTRAGKRSGSTGGTTILEAITVMLIVSIVARIAIPQFQEILTRARAAEIRATFDVVEDAANRLIVQNRPWPEDADAGVVPPELRPTLPPGFSFERGRYQLDWENWVLPNGMPGDSTVRRLNICNLFINSYLCSTIHEWARLREICLHGGAEPSPRLN